MMYTYGLQCILTPLGFVTGKAKQKNLAPNVKKTKKSKLLSDSMIHGMFCIIMRSSTFVRQMYGNIHRHRNRIKAKLNLTWCVRIRRGV